MRDFRTVRLGRMVVPAGILVLMLLQPDGASHADEQDLGPTYARVRYLEGALTVQRTGEGEVSQAGQNSPVAPGDSAWTDDGRAEIALADG